MSIEQAFRYRNSSVLLGAATIGLLAGAVAMCAQPAGAAPDKDHKVTICHATSSATNPFTVNTVDASSIANLDRGNGHGTHSDDVIPPFTDLKGLSYPGQNWNAGSAEFVGRGCVGEDGGGFPSG